MPGIEDFIEDPKDPKPKPKKEGKGIEDFFTPGSSTGSTLNMGRNTEVKLDEFTPYMKGGVNSDFNIQLQRAQNQGKLETLGKALGNTAANIVTGMGEMLGQAGSLVTEWGDDRDYSNFMTEKMEEWKNPFGEIYRENPNKVWDMTDSAWWAENLGQLAESAVAFAVPGGLAAKGFRWAASAVTEGLKLGRTGAAIARGIGQVASASLMGYQEGAMSGYRVYEQAYNTQLQKNINEGDDYETASQKAKVIAADAASTTVQMYTKLGAVLNLTAFSPLFKRADDEAYAWLSTQGRRQAGETVDGWRSRIANAGFDDKDIAKIFAPRSGITGMASETLQEGSEEFIQGYFDKTGEDIGRGKVSKNLDVVSDFFDKTMDQEGALNFALGALGGGAQTVLLDNIPLHRVQKFDGAGNPIFKTNAAGVVNDKDGNPQYETQLVSSRTRNVDKSKQYFKSVKDAIVADIDWFQKKNDEMMSTKDPVLKESLRAQMFNVNNLNAVTSGIADHWKQQYQEVRDIDNSTPLGTKMQPQIDEVTKALEEATLAGDPAAAELTVQRQELLDKQASLMGTTEAMQKGYAKDMNDNWYKEQAQEAIGDLGEMQKMWEVTNKKYGQTDEQKAAGLADYIFAHQVDLYRDKKILDKAEGEYATLLAEYEVRHAGLNEEFDMLARTYASDWDVLEKQRAGLTEDIKNIDKPEVQEKYHALEPKALRAQLLRKLDDINRAGEDLNAGLKTSFETSSWYQKNPGKSYEDYFKALQNKFSDRNDLNEYKVQIEQHRDRTSALNDKLNDLLTTKGIINTIKKAQAQKRNLIRELEERNKKDTTEARLTQRADAAAKTLEKTQLGIQERAVREQIVEVERRLTAKMKELQTEEAQLTALRKKTSLWSQITRDTDIDDLKQRMKTLRYDIAIDKRRLADLQSQLDTILGKITESDESPEPIVTAPAAGDTSTEGDAGGGVVEEEPEVVNEAERDYQKALVGLPEAVIRILSEYEMKVKSGVQPFAYKDILGLATTAGGPQWKDKVFAAVAAMRSYLETVPTEEDVKEEEHDVPPDLEDIEVIEDYGAEEYQEPIDVVDELTGADLVPEDYKDSPETVNVDVEVAGRVHKGKKATSGVTIVNATLDYIGYVDPKGNYRMVSPEGKLNPNTPESILDPKALTPGTTVKLRITEYSGPVNDNSGPNAFKTVPFADFFDEKGEVKRTEYAMGNVPIGIYDENDNLLGYLPTQERLHAQYPGATDYRNIAEDVQTQEAKRNMDLRRVLITNSTEGAGTIQISDKGPGSVIENQKKVSEGVYNRERKPARSVNKKNSMLPDESLSLAIISGGTVYEQNKGVSTKPMALNSADLKTLNKAPVVLLPMANGTYMPSPLYMAPLAGEGTNDIAVNSIMRVLELSFLNTAEAAAERDKISGLTGFDINTPEGVRAYINQYWTYTEKFTANDTMADPKAFKNGSKRQIFLFNITNTGTVMLGTKFNGTPPMKLTKANMEQFREALRAGLTQRYKNVAYTNDEVGIRGINSKGEFTEVVYNGTAWRAITHPSYNEYVKSHATTFVNGTNRLSSGAYVYSANPQIELDDSTLTVPKKYDAAVIPVPGNKVSEKDITLEDLLKEGNIINYEKEKSKVVYTNPGKYDSWIILIGQVTGTKTPLFALRDMDDPIIKKSWNYLRYQNGQFEIEEARKQTVVVPKTKEATIEDDDLLESLGIGFIQAATSVTTSIQPTATVRPITLDNLTELYNFTPSGERNGLTPEQVLEQMVKSGIPYIAEGHNPFIKCN